MWSEATPCRSTKPDLNLSGEGVEELFISVVRGWWTPMSTRHGLEENLECDQLEQVSSVRFSDQHLLKGTCVCEIALRMVAHPNDISLLSSIHSIFPAATVQPS